MSPRTDPWEEIPQKDRVRYQKLVNAFAPAIRLKPFDLWINFRGHHRIAILKKKFRGQHISRIQLALHYIWDAPSIGDLKVLRPNWVKATVKRWFERFERHVSQWGPGDIELVRIILQRVPTIPDLDLIEPSEFKLDEIHYRTGAHIRGVLGQAWEGNWDKLGNIQVDYKFDEAPFEVDEMRPILTIDSYHHSFFKPGETSAEALRWPNIVLPSFTYFPKNAWERFKIAKNNRGAEQWELV